jgi:hypothetical protein
MRTVLSLALALALALVAPTARADESLIRASFIDHCLEKPAEAEGLYQKAIDARPPLAPIDWGRAVFGLARVRVLDGRPDAGKALLEELAQKAGTPGVGRWPQRARAALDEHAEGRNPFDTEVQPDMPISLEASASPLGRVLVDLRDKTGLSFVLDAGAPEQWTVSVFLNELPWSDVLDHLFGKDHWKRMGPAVVIGKIAEDGGAWERAWSWGGFKDLTDQALGADLCSTRLTLDYSGVTLAEVAASFKKLELCNLEVPAAYAQRKVRVWAKNLPADRALDLIAVPLGLEWGIRDGKVGLRPRGGKDKKMPPPPQPAAPEPPPAEPEGEGEDGQ